MEDLYIQIVDGQPINHPVHLDNITLVYGEVPSGWLPFTRVPPPAVSTYTVYASDQPTYELINGVWSDVWHLRDMTDVEKAEKQQSIKDEWVKKAELSNFSAFVFDESICAYIAPIPRPDDGKQYFWQGITNSWQIRPPYPTDGGNYTLNYDTATWDLVTTS